MADGVCGYSVRYAIVLESESQNISGTILRVKEAKCEREPDHDGFHSFEFEWEG